MSFVTVNIDGYEVSVPAGSTILEAAEAAGIKIPTLCYDKRVALYGACGLCTVEAEGTPKLLRACSSKVSDGMVIHTDTERVKGSRKVALELLITDHDGDCMGPCSLACPAGTDCQGYVGLIGNGEYKEAVKLIKEKLPLPASIGRICPHPCETACRRQLVEEPISIAWLKSFVADKDLKSDDKYMPEIAPSTGKKVAVIGGGPAGLTAAYFLTVNGHAVTVFDKMPKMGGMLRYGIPQYRLPKEVLDLEVKSIEDMGVKLVNNFEIGKDGTFASIRAEYDAVLVTIGAWSASFMGVKGEDIDGVLGGIDFLRDVILGQPADIGKKVAVVGGGNTAMDACRTAVRLGAEEVYVIYRRTRDEMPAEDIEITEAQEEGVIFKFLTNPVEIIGEDGKVSKIKLQKMELGEPDAGGRRRPMPIEGAYEELDVDTVIMAIGQGINAKGFEELELTRKGTIAADEKTFRTSMEGVFAAGDATNKGASIAIEAIGEAQKASTVISAYLCGVDIEYKKPFYVERTVTAEEFADRKKMHRPQMPHLSPDERKHNFEEIVKGYTEEMAKQEASRCLECGCHDVHECKLVKYANDYDVVPQRFVGEKHIRKHAQTHPFIERNEDKCILCGLCVRVCDEVMGRTALGLVGRGFDTVVAPAFNVPLEKSDCVSCGQCVNLCPTGALREILPVAKSVPVAEDVTRTTCSFCSVGCQIDLTSKGNTLFRAIPAGDDGLLCGGGRFGYGETQSDKRIKSAMVRKNGVLEKAALDEAVEAVKDALKKYSSDEIAVSVSERYTLEEAYMIKKYANEVLGTDNVFSFAAVKSGVKDVLGVNASYNTLDELQKTNLIVLIGADVIGAGLIAGMKIKKAVEGGAKLVVIGNKDTQADEWAYRKYSTNDVSFLTDAYKVIAGEDAGDADVKEFAELYMNAKNAMIVIQPNMVSYDCAKAAAMLAKKSGHIGKAHNGLIQLKMGANSQGLDILGVKPYSDIDASKVKAMVVFGEVMPDSVNKPEFLAVQEVLMSASAEKADVVLPASTFAESSGTFVSADRKLNKVNKAIEPLCGADNLAIIRKLAGDAKGFAFENDFQVFSDICKNVEGFAGASKCACCGKHSIYWPVYASPVLVPSDCGEVTELPSGEIAGAPFNANAIKRSFAAKLG